MHNAIKAPDFKLNQCLFGLHRVCEDYEKMIGIVESEKTAIMMSIFLTDLLWMATGSKQNLKHELLKPVKNRDIVLYPDKGEFIVWESKAKQLSEQGYRMRTSELIEKRTDLENGTDLADLYLMEH